MPAGIGALLFDGGEAVGTMAQQLEAKQPGETFNPWHSECGFYPPDIVGRRLDLTDGQKRLYERLVRWAGQRGTCWYAFKTMADALGKSERQTQRDANTLEVFGLIRHVRRGKRQSNLYEFLWHSMFDGAKSDTTCMSDHPEDDTTSTVAVIRHPRQSDTTPMSYEFSKELCNRNCVKDTHTPTSGEFPIRTPLPQTSSHFDELWEKWPRKEQRDRAFRDWFSFVTVENEPAVMACAERYLASDEVSRGVVKRLYNFLEQQHRDEWAGEWPKKSKRSRWAEV